MEASTEPSGLKAAAMVDRGGGVSSQYVAAQRRRKSHSTKLPSRCPGSASTGSTGTSRLDADGAPCSMVNVRDQVLISHASGSVICALHVTAAGKCPHTQLPSLCAAVWDTSNPGAAS